jgi:hypothetical protein
MKLQEPVVEGEAALRAGAHCRLAAVYRAFLLIFSVVLQAA